MGMRSGESGNEVRGESGKRLIVSVTDSSVTNTASVLRPPPFLPFILGSQ